jgi:hypothetical protein
MAALSLPFFFFKRLKFYKLEKSTKNDQNLMKKFSQKNNLQFSFMIFMKSESDI